MACTMSILRSQKRGHDEPDDSGCMAPDASQNKTLLHGDGVGGAGKPRNGVCHGQQVFLISGAIVLTRQSDGWQPGQIAVERNSLLQGWRIFPLEQQIIAHLVSGLTVY